MLDSLDIPTSEYRHFGYFDWLQMRWDDEIEEWGESQDWVRPGQQWSPKIDETALV